MSDDIGDLARETRRRFVEGTLPIWLDRGWDATRGGCVERLEPDLTPTPVDYRRLMVHARMLYVFSYWGQHLGDRRLTERADRIADAMRRRFRDRAHGGWIARTDLAGGPRERDKDLYDHAFVLFGLSRRGEATGAVDDLAAAHAAATEIDEKFLEKSGCYADGFAQEFNDRRSGIRQNPHMHLLEAVLALHRATGDAAVLDRARRLVGLLRGRFLDPAGHVVEFFGDDLFPDPERGREVEPGHHAEWSWLLDRYAAAGGDGTIDGLAEALHRKALAIGEDPAHGGLYDVVDRTSGAVLRDTKRIWPVTEWIKSAVAARRRGTAPDAEVARPLALLLDRYLHADGTWTERLARDLSPLDRGMPASTVYHLSMAVEELEAIGRG